MVFYSYLHNRILAIADSSVSTPIYGNSEADLLAAHGTVGLRARVHKSLQDDDQIHSTNIWLIKEFECEIKEEHGIGATLNVAKPKKGSSVAVFGLGAVGLAKRMPKKGSSVAVFGLGAVGLATFNMDEVGPSPSIKLVKKDFAGKFALSSEEYTNDMVGAKSRNIAYQGKVPYWVEISTLVALPFGSFEKVLSDELNKNQDVTKVIRKVDGAYDCKIVEGELSHQPKQFVTDRNIVINVANPDTRVDDAEFEENEVEKEGFEIGIAKTRYKANTKALLKMMEMELLRLELGWQGSSSLPTGKDQQVRVSQLTKQEVLMLKIGVLYPLEKNFFFLPKPPTLILFNLHDERLYKSNHTAKHMTWHATGKSTENGKMQHSVDGKGWKNFDTRYPDFPTEKRNVRFGLAADGFNLFGNLSVKTIDAVIGKEFKMRVMLLWTINDFPARSILSGLSGQDPPRKFTREEILKQLDRFPTREKGKHPSYGGVKIKSNPVVKLNWTKRSIFYELEYWYFIILKHNLDVMHIKKKLLESFLGTLLMNDKSKDTTKARQELKNMGIRNELWLDKNQNRKCLRPRAKYSFTPDNRKKFCQFIKEVKLLDGFGSNFKQKVTDNDSNITGMKSHDCHIMIQRLLPYGLQQYLDLDVATPIIELCSFFKQIYARTLIEDNMVKAESQLIDILCNLEQIYPAFFDIIIHLVIHLSEEALKGGPNPYRTIGKRSVIRLDHQEMKKVIWYVLHNSPEIDTYLAEFESLNDLDFVTLNIDGQSTKVVAPQDIIVIYDNDDFIDDEDDVHHDLADFDDEVLAKAATVAGAHGGDGGGEPPPPLRQTGHDFRGVGGQKATKRGRGGGRDGGRKGVRKETGNLTLKKSMDEYGALSIRFEWNNKGTMLHLGPITARWSDFVGELVREFPMYYPSWTAIEKSKRAHIMGRLMHNFDLMPHMRSLQWPDIELGIEKHFAKIYANNKARHPTNIEQTGWDKQIAFWLDPKNAARAAQNSKNRARNTVFCWQGSRSLAVLRDQQEEMVRLRDLGADTPTGVPYTKEQILAMVVEKLKKRMLRQLGSQSEISEGSGSRSDGGGDGQLGGDEVANGDDDIN
ncbi:zinc finger, PHD-type containing protein [Tanacetum coccineum]|uniref:Zinc finger, PHD-type containing protein n=1 Tax=Tanacetum coccineum TaxID=301880 RepID=A0ABQ4X4U2_9ASTR